MIRVNNLSVTINGSRLLSGVSFSVPAGSVLGVIGESGGGKTTLLSCICGLLPFQAGTVEVNGTKVSAQESNSSAVWELRRHTGVVFQHLYLFPHLTVMENLVEAPVHVNKEPVKEAVHRATVLLHAVGINNKQAKYPAELSGGEQQRVAICRALMMQPAALLLDEPTSALDPQRSSDIRRLLQNYVDEGHTLVVISHAIPFLRGLADYLVFVEKGVVAEFGPAAELLEKPQNESLRKFLSHI